MAKRQKFAIPDLSSDKSDKNEILSQSLFKRYQTQKEDSEGASNAKQPKLVSHAAPVETPPEVHSVETSQDASQGGSAAKSSEIQAELPSAVKRAGSNSLIVSSRQRGNPLLKFIRNVSWEFGDCIPDYVLSRTSCALFLSLRYHKLNPEYIHNRLRQLGRSFDLRVLLVQVDIKDPYQTLKYLSQMCVLADCVLMLAWSAEEAARYLETYKAFENKPPDLIMEKPDTDTLGRVSDVLTSARRVNKTDAMTLLTTFGSVEEIVSASEEDLSLCPGFGPQKAKRLHDIMRKPFLKNPKH